MEQTPAEIAAKLTKAQRESILGAQDMMNSHGGYPYFTVRHTGKPWPMGIAQFLTLKTDRLSPLGLAVRAELQKAPKP